MKPVLGSLIIGALLVFVAAPTRSEHIKIPHLYQEIAAANRIPAKLFFAVILNESRSIVSNTNGPNVLPWPWTVNYKGKGYYFATREQAYRFLVPIAENGQTAGIGLGQIEWKWHKNKFTTLWEALDPRKNLNVSAKYIRKQFDRKECNSWKLAIGCYHRPAQSELDKKIAERYTNKVMKIWRDIK